jgi:hypothetical protein
MSTVLLGPRAHGACSGELAKEFRMSKSAMSTVVTIFGAALAPALVACAHSVEQPMTAQARLNACPLAHLSGVKAAVTDTPDGATILFTAQPNEQDQLTASVQAMADANRKQGNPFAACPCATPGPGVALMQAQAMPGGGCSACAPEPTPMPPASAKVVTTPAGTELQLKLEDEVSPTREIESSTSSDRLAKIRMAARQHVAYLSAACLSPAHR